MRAMLAAAIGLFANKKGPWGGGDDEPVTPRPTGPWGGNEPTGDNNPTALDEWLKARRGGGSGGGTGGPSFRFGGGQDASIWKWGLIGFLLLWLMFTTTWSIRAEERGVVTRFGRYSHTLSPGVGITMPWPVDRVTKVNVGETREMTLGSDNEETQMLTGDQNIIDIAYQVRWNVKEPEAFLFELSEPEESIRQVAESAMRQVIANFTLTDAMGNKRGEIEARVQQEMQQTLDAYKSGVVILGVAVKQADPPAAVNEAFKEVTAAQQAAQSDVNQANAYALQMRQVAQGEATAFDKVYEQYKLAPEVTRRRMYYETMERILRSVDKTIVETPGVTPYLPLPSVGRSQPAAGGAK